jgi:hypothetical protein
MIADFLRIVLQGLLVSAVALIAGMDFATGVVGAVVMVLIASVAGIAYSAIDFSIALKTGNAQTTQSIWALWIPFMFRRLRSLRSMRFPGGSAPPPGSTP